MSMANVSSFFKQKSTNKIKKKELDLSKVKTADVYIHHTTGEDPDVNYKAKIKIEESTPKASRVEIDNELMILDCDINSTINEKELIGQSWIGWFAGAFVFIGFDLYRMLHELLNFTWQVGLADALYLLVFGTAVFGWASALSKKTFKEMNLIFNEETNTYSSFILRHQAYKEQQTIEALVANLYRLQQSLKNSDAPWLCDAVKEIINSLIALTIDNIYENFLKASDPSIAFAELDDFLNVFEPVLSEITDDDSFEELKDREQKLLEIIEGRGDSEQ